MKPLQLIKNDFAMTFMQFSVSFYFVSFHNLVFPQVWIIPLCGVVVDTSGHGFEPQSG